MDNHEKDTNDQSEGGEKNKTELEIFISVQATTGGKKSHLVLVSFFNHRGQPQKEMRLLRHIKFVLASILPLLRDVWEFRKWTDAAFRFKGDFMALIKLHFCCRSEPSYLPLRSLPMSYRNEEGKSGERVGCLSVIPMYTSSSNGWLSALSSFFHSRLECDKTHPWRSYLKDGRISSTRALSPPPLKLKVSQKHVLKGQCDEKAFDSNRILLLWLCSIKALSAKSKWPVKCGVQGQPANHDAASP